MGVQVFLGWRCRNVEDERRTFCFVEAALDLLLVRRVALHAETDLLQTTLLQDLEIDDLISWDSNQKIRKMANFKIKLF